ncbi:MAG: hypothetical protein ACM31C_33415 [Acidobacteriota bacterium]
MAKLRVAWRGVRILHTSLIASLAIYAGIVAIVTQQPQKKADVFTTDPQLVLTIFGALSLVVLAGVIPILRRKMLPERDRVGDGHTVDLDTEIDPTIKGVLLRLQPAFVATWALCEAVATFGLVLGFLYWDLRYYLPFGGVALVAMIFFAPRVSLLEECMRVVRRQGP